MTLDLKKIMYDLWLNQYYVNILHFFWIPISPISYSFCCNGPSALYLQPKPGEQQKQCHCSRSAHVQIVCKSSCV